MGTNKFEMSQKEIMEIVTESVTKKIVNLIENYNSPKKYEISEGQLYNMLVEALTRFDSISNDSVFGSDKYDIAEEYEAVDNETVMDVLSELKWECSNYMMVQSPTGKKAIRYEIQPLPGSHNINRVIASLKSRATMPEGIRFAKKGGTYNDKIQPYYIISYIYNN